MMIEIKPEILKDIAENLDMGMLCFYNKTTGNVETYPEELEGSDLEDEWADVLKKIEYSRDDYLQIAKMGKREAFEMMKKFADGVQHIPTRNKFAGALSRKKPFSNFQNTLSYYPDLREQWFFFKLQMYIGFVKDQVDLYNKLNDPIKGFYIHLEYHLTRALQNLPDKELSRLWCDGVWDDMDNPVSIQNVVGTHEIKTLACIAQRGCKNQELFELSIKLGPEAIKKHAEGLNIVDCLPGEELLNWVDIDLQKKSIKLKLK